MNEVYTICSDSGDEYKLQFTTDRSGIISDDILDLLNQAGIDVIEVGLGRSAGLNTTSLLVMAQIENCIADVLHRYPNAVLSFFCDFINLIPSTKKKIPVQEYRSRLFSLMFDRFISLHGLKGFNNKVIVVQGVAEPFYFHIIVRDEHLEYANMIAEGHHNDFDK